LFESRIIIQDMLTGRFSGAVNNTGALEGATANWTSSTSSLQVVEADVLHILDCCYVAQASKGFAEVLAATSATELAGSDIDTSFTKALINELKAASSHIVTAAQIHGRLMRGMKPNGLQYTPYHAARDGWASCKLRRMEDTVQSKDKGKAGDDKRILVGVTVNESLQPADVEKIKNWLLTGVPDVVKGMDIELSGLWDTTSTFLTFTVPIEVWTQLPADSAWIYIATVSSGNNMLRLAAAQASTLTDRTRPPQGGENVRPGSSGKGSGYGT
jgi:hypothetical protein